jgi:predicted 3-demethylubiquinone-9 3-methyltransferase (glyoxalase superfamily)
MDHAYAKDHSILVVRRSGGGAANFYVSVFKNPKVKEMTHYTGEEPSGEKGSVMTVSFELDGQEFVALNGRPRFKFTEAVSFVVNCETQKEIDYYWESSRPAAVRRCNAAGSRINMVSPGRWCRRSGPSGAKIRPGCTR